jgi:hypothetical protein
MKNSEEAIEKVLAGLRDADAPVGMERRILDALENPASARSRSGWRWLRPMWLVAPAHPVAMGSLACGVVLAAIVAFALAIPAIRRLGNAPAQSKMNLAPSGALPSTTSDAISKSARVPLPATSARSIGRTNACGETNARTAEAVHSSDHDITGDSDSVAVSEMLAPSHPAPPMPLTEQERLLLRIAHRGDPVEMAMLDPRMRAARDAEEGAEFQRFFGAVANGQRTIEQPKAEQPTTEQPKAEQPVAEQPATEQSATEQSTREPSTTRNN